MNETDLTKLPPKHFGPPKPGQCDETRAFQGIPSIERTLLGRLWAAWYGGGFGEDRHNYILLATSKDDGASWSKPLLTLDPDGDGPVRAFDPCLWLDPRGALWLFWSQGTENHTVPDLLWAMRTENPDDESPRWSKPALLGPGILMNKPLVLSSGEWLLPVAIWKRMNSSAPAIAPESEQAESWKEGSAGVWRSRDFGNSWQALGAATVSIKTERCCDEHMLLERSDGVLVMWVRTRYGIGCAFSRNRGLAWSMVYPSELAHTASRFFVRRLASGNLLLVKHGHIHEKTKRSHLRAFISNNEGATWAGGLLLDERTGVSYPDATQGHDGVIRLIYDFERSGAKQILMARFMEQDVLNGSIATPAAALRILINQAFGKQATNETRDQPEQQIITDPETR